MFFFTVFILSCKSSRDNQRCEEAWQEKIQGDWERIFEKQTHLKRWIPPSNFRVLEGMTITKDSIDFYKGFFGSGFDSVTKKRTFIYLGNLVPYKVGKCRIIIKNPLTKKWEVRWKFVGRNSDTLCLAINDSSVIRYHKINYNHDTSINFDQIVYSSSGCFGSCPILDISLDSRGNVFFHGEGYVEPLGIYATKISESMTRYIFRKFNRANPLTLPNNYSIATTDQQAIVTTFIKNKKVIKTIYDYGESGPKELVWAYQSIRYIYSTAILNLLPRDEPFYPELAFYTFKKGNRFLPLEKSQSFYLWTELVSAKRTNVQFQPKYQIVFRNNYTYFGPDPAKEKRDKNEIPSITSDGRFFNFKFIVDSSSSYDLGYNFIKRNFEEGNFKTLDDLQN